MCKLDHFNDASFLRQPSDKSCNLLLDAAALVHYSHSVSCFRVLPRSMWPISREAKTTNRQSLCDFPKFPYVSLLFVVGHVLLFFPVTRSYFHNKACSLLESLYSYLCLTKILILLINHNNLEHSTCQYVTTFHLESFKSEVAIYRFICPNMCHVLVMRFCLHTDMQTCCVLKSRVQ